MRPDLEAFIRAVFVHYRGRLPEPAHLARVGALFEHAEREGSIRLPLRRTRAAPLLAAWTEERISLPLETMPKGACVAGKRASVVVLDDMLSTLLSGSNALPSVVESEEKGDTTP